MGRMGTPEDIGNAVSLLCMDEASFITGQILHVDGGSSVMDPAFPLEIQRGYLSTLLTKVKPMEPPVHGEDGLDPINFFDGDPQDFGRSKTAGNLRQVRIGAGNVRSLRPDPRGDAGAQHGVTRAGGDKKLSEENTMANNPPIAVNDSFTVTPLPHHLVPPCASDSAALSKRPSLESETIGRNVGRLAARLRLTVGANLSVH